MSIEPKGFTRKPFRVDAVQVTEENIKDVADWCGGAIEQSNKAIRDEKTNKVIERKKIPFVRVPVHNPLNDRQTKAYTGDWVLQSEAGFKVYTERAFDNSFDPEKKVVKRKRFRDAGNGEYVTQAFARANPDTTVSEDDYELMMATR